MASSILTQLLRLINHGSTLEQAVEQTVPGADADYWRKRIERHQSGQQPPKKSPKKSPSRSGSSRRRMTNSVPLGPSSFEAQTQQTGRATADLVERANNKPDEGESRFAWLTCGGFTTVLEVVL